MLNIEINSKDEKNMELSIYNCSGIIKCEEDYVVLGLHSSTLNITGFSLSVNAYLSGEVYVEGQITKIEFFNDKLETATIYKIA